jgi:hypothetical protein
MESLLFIVALVVTVSMCVSEGLFSSSTAKLTYYQSYPMCCPKSPNYDPKYPTEECDDYSGCKYMGQFAGLGHESYDYVKT